MLLLTPGPLPTGDTDLTRRLRAGLQHDLSLSDGAVRIEARGVATDRIEQIGVDLTGTNLQQPPQVLPAGAGTPVQIEALQVAGQDLLVRSVPVWLLATAQDLACQWRTTTDGHLRLEPAAQGGAGHGRFILRARPADLEPVVARIAAPLLAEHGFSLTGSSLHLPPGEGDLPFRADLEVVRGPLAATVQVTGTLTPGPDMSLGLLDLRATSSHPLVAMGLNMLTGTLQRMQERRYGPPESLTAPWATTNAQLSATQDEVQFCGDLHQRPT